MVDVYPMMAITLQRNLQLNQAREYLMWVGGVQVALLWGNFGWRVVSG